MSQFLTNLGKKWINDKLSGAVATTQNRIGWGTGAGTSAAADTTLFSESADETRAAGTYSSITTTLANDTYQEVGTLTCAVAGKTITNAGLFDAATGGVMLIKGDHTGIPLLVGDQMQYTFQLQVT